MRFHGFTLIELIISLFFITLISLLTLQSWTSFKQEKEALLLINDIKNAIHYAKTAALNESHSLMLVPLSKHNWSSGMNLIDENNHLLHQWQWSLRNWQLTWQGVDGSQQLCISGKTNALNSGRFTLEQKTTHKKISLILNRIGRVKQVNEVEK